VASARDEPPVSPIVSDSARISSTPACDTKPVLPAAANSRGGQHDGSFLRESLRYWDRLSAIATAPGCTR
jgi:hypothetical protein